MRAVLALLILPLLIVSAAETPLADVAESGRKEARDALSDLRSFREESYAVQKPLEEKILGLRSEMATLRGELDHLREARDSGDVALAEMEEELSRMRAERETAESVLAELLAVWTGSGLSFSDPEARAEALSLIEGGSLAEGGVGRLGSLLRGIAVDLRSLIGGRIGPLSVFTGSGRRVTGTGIFLGPLVFLSGEGDGATGVVDLSDPDLPRVVPSPPDEVRRIQETLASRGGILPIDPTGGAALALRRSEPGLMGEITRGGIWIYPILFAAAVALVVAIVKWMSISRVRRSARRGRADFAKCSGDDAQAAFRSLKKRQAPLLIPFWETLFAHRSSDSESRDDLIHARLIEIRLRLTRGLAALSVIAATTPLLGLLGTVTGMISTFRRITLFGAGDPQSLSGGISEALLTTKFGLVVAIPTFLVYAFLSRRAQGTITELDAYAQSAVGERQ